MCVVEAAESIPSERCVPNGRSEAPRMADSSLRLSGSSPSQENVSQWECKFQHTGGSTVKL